MKIITDITSLKQLIPTTKFSKVEEELASAALLTAIAEHKCLGMSANQIGLNKRICVINVREEPLILVNPTIITSSEETLVYLEGCLSIPKTLEKPLKTLRNYEVTIKADNYTEELHFGTTRRSYKDGYELLNDVDLLESVCVQHEIDHLNGITIRERQYTTTVEKSSYDKLGRNEKLMLKSPEGKTEMVKKKKVQEYLHAGYEVI
jgi:peptide deformylase